MAAFIAALAESGIVAKACEAVDIARRTAYEWREEHPAFAEAWDKALKIGITALEDEAARRAFLGTDKPLVHQGQKTPEFERDANGEIVYYERVVEIKVDGVTVERVEKVPKFKRDAKGGIVYQTMKEYSDTLAIFLLKAHAPEKYRENVHIEHAGSIDIPNRLIAGRRRTGGR